ncbi:DUF1883 domain-containing protein [Bradyrhizobium sp. 31Argb]|uniref:DUF1883 domain-containing protein n=1 Tax=Bradyrhizobium sp. 31Argb TaxID=3141247 RepID=UPI00102EC25A|nr:hypothetical protein CWO89_43870 [Bradyrhizobium sp. Leo170]
MDSSNFANYRQGGQHRYFGGRATRSPFRLQVPSAGRWHVAVDLEGYSGSVQAGVRILS